MRLSFLHKPYPVISGIRAGQTPGELIAEARGAEADGAQRHSPISSLFHCWASAVCGLRSGNRS